ncbi:2OG-Fe(II) oxygenase [Geminocystis sp. GBBB08]|uniref:2OG-Fe(II) oxygenase n=1 Tax=Geminocystis sp. GBBB08 TaxID=2604140 RepID=UPI0027E373D8|nr:2OG-Fe(II) oxygenase [Geminocystis sp. GBBB08]MBL1208908.1 2OG-Fe(II) oxygenase [Geminocystis sp. GBBB08]
MNTLKSKLKFCLEPEYLDSLVTKYSKQYITAKPFPHIVIDNFLPEAVLEDVLAEFPQPDQIKWQQFDTVAESKLASTSELLMGEATRFLLYQLNSSVFINFLERLTSIEGIIPDPHFIGGGLHQIKKGGFLKVHVDFNKHSKMNLDRRLNLLIYLNKDWEEEYGGYFELWNPDVTICEKKLLPIFNRCVIFSTSEISYHGHPEPLTCPDQWTRKSLALYYYSQGRPEEEKADNHSTIFKERPGEKLIPKKETIQTKELLKKFIPPILLDLKKSLLN